MENQHIEKKRMKCFKIIVFTVVVLFTILNVYSQTQEESPNKSLNVSKVESDSIMEKIKDFEWYNDLGETIHFTDTSCLGKSLEFPIDFYLNSEINEFRSIGVRWKCDEKLIDMPDVGFRGCCPVPTMDRVIVSYERDHIIHSAIYNADGSLYMEINVPQRSVFDTQERTLRAPSSPSFIADIAWVKDPKDDFTMWIELRGRTDPYWELFRFNPITGEFGESVSHGCF